MLPYLVTNLVTYEKRKILQEKAPQEPKHLYFIQILILSQRISSMISPKKKLFHLFLLLLYLIVLYCFDYAEILYKELSLQTIS